MAFGFSAIEVIAGLFALFVLVKVITITVKKKAWFNTMVKPSVSKTEISFVFLLISAVIFYFLIQTLTIVEIFAVLAFCSFFIFLGLIVYSRDTLAFAKKIYGKKFNVWVWVQIIIWAALSIWVLLDILL